MYSKGFSSKREMKWVLSAMMVLGSLKKLENAAFDGKIG
jgi:hypothetical protein